MGQEEAAMYFAGMQRLVIAAVMLVSVLLAVGNNLVNEDRVTWIGSPEVLEKPSDWPSLSLGQGIAAGTMVAWKDLVKQALPVGLGLILVLGVAAFLVFKRKVSVVPWLHTVLRLLLAGMFIAAAWPKFTDPEGFATLVAQYQFLPPPLVNIFSLWLPAFELVVAFGLLFLPYEKEMGALVLVMLGMFLIALAQALARNLGIACGCFDIEGAADAGGTWYSFLRDIVLVFPVVWLMVSGKKRWLWQLG
jgi:uncharacterized membrane protein YphA (DoxX/SURF4 family)